MSKKRNVSKGLASQGTETNTLQQGPTGKKVDILLEKLPGTDESQLGEPQKKIKNHILRLCNLHIAYGENVIFDNFSYKLEGGKTYILRGPSGCGKSTLMRSIAGLVQYTGKILLNSQKLHGTTPDVYMMQQYYYLFPWLNLINNVLMVFKAHKVKPTLEDIEEVKAILIRLGLEEHMYKLPSQISGGQAQRVAFACAMINRWSPVILLDEPTSALDGVNDILVADMILEHQKKYGTIVILITHEDHVAERLGGTVLELIPEFRLRKRSAEKSAVDVNPEVIPQKELLAEKNVEIPTTAEEEAPLPTGPIPQAPHPENTTNQNGISNAAETVGDTN